MKGLVIALGLLCGCRQVLGFDEAVAPPGSSDAASDTPAGDGTPAVAVTRQIDIVDAKVIGGPHADFPLMIAISDPELRSTRNGGKVQSESGFDIVFTSDQAGTTKLAHEVDAYDPNTGNLLAWVKIPSLTGVTVLFVHYGDPSITASQENVTAVWSASYAGVWHLTDLDDSTGHSATATATGDPPLVAGKLAGARDFDGGGSRRLSIAANAAIADVFDGGGTAEAWINPRSAGQGAFGRIFDKEATNFTLGDGSGAINSLQISHLFSVAAGNFHTGFNTLPKNQLQHVVAVYDSSSAANVPTVYIDGAARVASDNDTPGGAQVSDAQNPLVIGDRAAGGRAFDGIIDEVRLSTTMRDAGWIATEFENQLDPTTFLVIGPPL